MVGTVLVFWAGLGRIRRFVRLQEVVSCVFSLVPRPCVFLLFFGAGFLLGHALLCSPLGSLTKHLRSLSTDQSGPGEFVQPATCLWNLYLQAKGWGGSKKQDPRGPESKKCRGIPEVELPFFILCWNGTLLNWGLLQSELPNMKRNLTKYVWCTPDLGQKQPTTRVPCFHHWTSGKRREKPT